MTITEVIRRTIWLVVGLCAVFFLLPTSPLAPTQVNLDQSWRIALQVAFDKGLVFGRDFIFTYGPLGFLSARIYADSTKWRIFTYDLFIALQFFLVWIAVYRHSSSIVTALLLGGVFLTLGGALYFLDPPIVLFILSTFWLFIERNHRSTPVFLLSLLNALLSFYIKVNLGIAAIGQLLVLNALDLLSPTFRRRAAAYLVTTLAIAALSSQLINVAVIDYTIASLHIANGFNDAMYVDSIDSAYLLWALGVVTLLVIALTFTFFLGRSPILILSCAGFAFLLFKQAFVRSDEHIFVFFDYIVIPFALLALFSTGNLRKINCGFVVCVIAISFHLSRTGSPSFSDKFLKCERYWASIDPGPAPIPFASPLSKTIIDDIGTHSVDLMPDNTSILVNAGLDYLPRPVIQSYSAYDSYLDSVNSRFLAERGQEKIVFSHGCIDYRYCLHDETSTKLTMLQHYDLSAHTNEYFVMTRRQTPLTLEKTLIRSGRQRLGDRLVISGDESLLLAVFKINYSLRGKFRRFFFRPSPLRLTVQSPTSKKDYRAILPILNGGVIINRAIDDEAAQALFLKREFKQIHKTRLLDSTRRVHVTSPNISTMSYTEWNTVSVSSRKFFRYAETVLGSNVLKGFLEKPSVLLILLDETLDVFGSLRSLVPRDTTVTSQKTFWTGH